jgi:hypothetical protein
MSITHLNMLLLALLLNTVSTCVTCMSINIKLLYLNYLFMTNVLAHMSPQNSINYIQMNHEHFTLEKIQFISNL